MMSASIVLFTVYIHIATCNNNVHCPNAFTQPRLGTRFTRSQFTYIWEVEYKRLCQFQSKTSNIANINKQQRINSVPQHTFMTTSDDVTMSKMFFILFNLLVRLQCQCGLYSGFWLERFFWSEVLTLFGLYCFFKFWLCYICKENKEMKTFSQPKFE